MLLRILVAVAVAALAFGLRCRAIELLPTDYDETPYLSSAQQLADVLRSGDLAALTTANLQPEHPQLNQLLFAVALLAAPDSEPSPDRSNARGGSSKLPEAELLAARSASPQSIPIATPTTAYMYLPAALSPSSTPEAIHQPRRCVRRKR